MISFKVFEVRIEMVKLIEIYEIHVIQYLLESVTLLYLCKLIRTAKVVNEN